MKVPEVIRTAWNTNYEHGDYQAIAKKYSMSVMTARRAIKTGRCAKATYAKINEYYIEKNNAPIEIVKQINAGK